MCTVTVVRGRAGAVRLACNRDEQHARAAALLPEVRSFGRRQALLPIDSHSGGTWIAASDAGLALTLLNVNPGEDAAPAAASRSRGTIIPELLSSATLAEAVAHGLALDAASFAPFRLVIVDGRDVAELHSDGRSVHLLRQAPLEGPLLFTSSGLGDDRVAGPRRQLFGELVAPAADGPAGQDAYHRHHWPERPHLSVCMRRADARTVSHTVVTLAADAVRLDYHPDAPDVPAESSSLMLTRSAGGGA